jgi:oligosaccharide translocation protein RFT1
LEFLVNTILFFSREGERLAIQRTEQSKNSLSEKRHNESKFYDFTIEGKLQSIINFGFLPLIIGIPISCIIGMWQFQSVSLKKSLFALPNCTEILAILALSILLELFVEPIYAINQYELNFQLRSKSEGLAIFNKCISTFFLIYISKDRAQFNALAIRAFAVGQLVYSLTLLVCYLRNFHTLNRVKYSIKPIYVSDKSDDNYYFNSKVLQVWKNLFVQMIFKQFLTEGDKLIINYLLTIEQQAVYAVVSNYGSIIARLLFQPIEESMRLLFTRLLATPTKESITSSFEMLKNLSLLYLNLSVLLLLAGVTNCSYLLKILLGSKSIQWSNSNLFEVFPQYVVYICIMAFNGIYEAFFTSIANNRQIKNFSLFMSISCGIVLVAVYILIEKFSLGLTGLLIANMVNMTLRIGYCQAQIKGFYQQHGVGISNVSMATSVLKYGIVGVCFETAQVVINKTLFTQTFRQFLTSGVICVCCLITLCLMEKTRIVTALTSMKTKQD